MTRSERNLELIRTALEKNQDRCIYTMFTEAVNSCSREDSVLSKKEREWVAKLWTFYQQHKFLSDRQLNVLVTQFNKIILRKQDLTPAASNVVPFRRKT